MTGSFITVGSNGKFKLSDLAVDTNGEYCEDNFTLSTLTPSGGTDKEYCWFYDKGHGGKTGVAGWYDSDGEIHYAGEDDVEFESSQGFWVQGYGFKLKASGQVLIETVVAATPTAGKVLIGNPFSSDVNLADIAVDTDGEYCEDNLTLSTLTPSGGTDKEYCWFYDKGHGGKSGVAGWYDSDGETLYTREDGILLKAGGAYWVQGYGFKLIFQKPDYE